MRIQSSSALGLLVALLAAEWATGFLLLPSAPTNKQQYHANNLAVARCVRMPALCPAASNPVTYPLPTPRITSSSGGSSSSSSAGHRYAPAGPSSSVRCQAAASAAASLGGAGLAGVGSDDRASALSGLMEWYAKNGIKDSKVKVGPSPSGTGLGLLATSGIKRGEQVLIVPLSLAISMDTVRAGPVGRAIGGWEPNLGETTLLAVQLLYEAAQGDKSKYAAFLRGLPRPGQDGFDHPLFWEVDELSVLAQSSTRNLKEQLVDPCEADLRALRASVLSKGGIPGLGADSVDAGAFKWAVATVLSRSFFAEGGLRLCPLLDMANHGSAAQGNEPEAAGLGIFGGKGLRVVADRDYAAGEEVRISYGPKSGIEFLEDHGFVPDLGDPLVNGICELAFEVTEDDKFLDDKEDILMSAELGLRQTFDVNAAGDVDGAMIQFLRLKCLRDKDAFLLEAVFRQDVLRFMELPVSEANEQAVDELLIARCQEAINAFKEAKTMTASAMEQMGAEMPALKRQRLEAMKRVRQSEKAALEAAQAWAERDMTTGDIKVYYQERRLEELQLCGPLSDDEMTGGVSGGRSSRSLDW